MLKEILIIRAGIPIGLYGYYLTSWEKEIYSKPQYFPILLWIIAISASVFWSLDKTIALTLTTVFIAMLTWFNTDKIIKFT
jgi:hypothetical protein